MQTRNYKLTLLRAFGLFVLLTASIMRLCRREIQQRNLNRSLIAAIQRADARTTHDLLDRGADPDAAEAPQGEISIWRMMWDRLRGVSTTNEAGTTALLLAVNLPCEIPNAGPDGNQPSISIVKALLDHGADVRTKDADGFDVVYDCMQCAYDDETLRLLIRRHAAVNLHSPASGRTPLMNAAGWGSPETMNLLLASGANINDQDEDGSTALMYAVSKARDDNVAALLAHHADIYIKDKTGSAPLSSAQAGLASNRTTPNIHGTEHETWRNIVHLLEKAAKQTAPHPH